MAYSQNLEVAAKRHLKAAQLLHDEIGPGNQPGCRAVAAYLFGLAGELALKELMRKSGIKPLPTEERRSDPFYAHFPALKGMIEPVGRRGGELRKFVEDPKLFHNWATDMRYAPTKDIEESWVLDWRKSAERLVGTMGIE